MHDTLEGLIERDLVERLDRRPGQKEERYRQLLEDPGEEQANGASSATHVPAEAQEGLHERVSRLEREVAELRVAIGDPVAEGAP